MQSSLLSKGSGAFASTLAIVAVSAFLGLLVSWRAPGLDRYAADWLMRARGTLPVPDDIAIVAIDEASIARFGRFPWRRSLLARTIDAIAAGQPRAIAVDVLFPDPTSPEEDDTLSQAVRRARIVLAAQLVNSDATDAASWLMPHSTIARPGLPVGHVNVLTESDGTAREFLVRLADSAGQSLFALPVEVVRIGDGVSEQSVVDSGEVLILGRRAIPLNRNEGGPPIAQISGGPGQASILRAGRIAIDYIGPTGSFSPNTFSAADVLESRTPPEAFRGRYVLVGATAAAVGERFASPFVHSGGVHPNQHGTLMPGVEVLANAVNTIARSRFYAATPDSGVLAWGAMVAAATLLFLAAAQGRFAAAKQCLALACTGTCVVLASYLTFKHLLVVPPLAPGLVSFASAGVLGLLRRTLITSWRLDNSIADIAKAERLLAAENRPDTCARAIADLTQSAGAAIFATNQTGRHTLIAQCGAAVVRDLQAARGVNLPSDRNPSLFFVLPEAELATFEVHVERLKAGEGILVILNSSAQPLAAEAIRIGAAIAEDCVARYRREPHDSAKWRWPSGLEDKARMLGELNGQFLDRARFVDLAMRSVEDGLVITTPSGLITFANQAAAAIFQSTEARLIGRNLFQRLAECESSPGRSVTETLARLLLDRSPVEQEIAIRGPETRQYILRIAPAIPDEGPVPGLIASLSDITRQKALQQTQKDVISLVSHEMRTPLSAIQGMSELLANYDIAPDRRREMNIAINDEVKRLTNMVTQYLDLARLESGATPLHPVPVRLDTTVERSLMLLEHAATQRQISLIRRFAPNLPPVVADPDLLARTADNLVSNAIKYSPPGTSVIVSLRKTGNDICLEVTDQGYGIPAADIDRVFEKFYRVPRARDADVPGTGLGLAMVREIAELHGGSVTVSSEVNIGSTFTLTIPLQQESGRGRMIK